MYKLVLSKQKKKMKYEKQYIKQVHQFSSAHKKELLKSELCGCFYCCRTFKPDKIVDWIEDKNGETAICPLCGIDSVLSDKHPISDNEFLSEMNKYWF